VKPSRFASDLACGAVGAALVMTIASRALAQGACDGLPTQFATFSCHLCIDQISPSEFMRPTPSDCRQRAIVSDRILANTALSKLMTQATPPSVIQQYGISPPQSSMTVFQPQLSPVPSEAGLSGLPPVKLGVTAQPTPFSTVAPVNPQVWSLTPRRPLPRRPDFSALELQPLPSKPITKQNLSAWCEAFNTVKGVTESTLAVRETAGMLGLTAEDTANVASIAREAALNRTLIFLVAAGTVVYVVGKQCAPVEK
jgi:hypothetical protein